MRRYLSIEIRIIALFIASFCFLTIDSPVYAKVKSNTCKVYPSIESDDEEANSASSIVYVTPEQFGAKGDGITDDTAAFEKCMQDPTKNVILRGTYLITRYISTDAEKIFFALPQKGYAGASIICNAAYDYKTLSFENVTFKNIAFYSTVLRTGTSPHGETYQKTSNIVFVEIWNGSGTFENCYFTNALIAIRGRKHTDLDEIPQSIQVDRCTFTDCKIPIQGYSKYTEANDSSFINDGDVYSGDHCIYMEEFGCRSLSANNCTVETKNTESGAAFQIYSKEAISGRTPSLIVDGCKINANGVASTRRANVVIKNTVFHEQRPESFIMWVESGSAVLMNSEFYHSFAFSYADTIVKPYAVNCTFTLLRELSDSKCNFPYQSYYCTYVNWGGKVRLDNTLFTGCTFTSEQETVLGELYISNESGFGVSLINTTFKKGPIVTDNRSALLQYTGCSMID